MVRERVRAAVDQALELTFLEGIARRSVARRPCSIVLVWHRIEATPSPSPEVIDSLATETFAAQLDVLSAWGDIVPLAEIDRPNPGGLRFALTFDDDDLRHARSTLPVLVDRDLPATFFLSGRWLWDDGPYWWEVLEKRIRRDGLADTSAALRVPEATTAGELAVALTATPVAAALAEEGRSRADAPLGHDEAAAIVAAGAEIGYHTRHHPSLPGLDDTDLAEAVSGGRDRLARDLGVRIERFAYPHGHVDRRVADVVRAAGYESGWTTAKRVAGPQDDPMRRGRWDLASATPRQFRGRIARAALRGGA